MYIGNIYINKYKNHNSMYRVGVYLGYPSSTQTQIFGFGQAWAFSNFQVWLGQAELEFRKPKPKAWL